MANLKTKKLTTLGMLTALAFLSVFIVRIPLPFLPPFLKYEPKDVIILIAGFIYGPISATLVSVLVSLIEFVTISSTGWIGLVMNILSTVAFVVPASYFYKRNRNSKSAIIGLIVGGIATTIVMLLWNYWLTPIYMNIPREKVLPLLPTAILPFNLLKSAINGILILLIYKPVVTALRKANFVESSPNTNDF